MRSVQQPSTRAEAYAGNDDSNGSSAPSTAPTSMPAQPELEFFWPSWHEQPARSVTRTPPEVLRAGLPAQSWGRGRSQHGFHSGEAGVAFFFLRLAECLDAPGYVAAADMRLRRLRGAAPLTIDLMYGTAGTILGLLAMHAVTGDVQFLAEARVLGDQLIGKALKSEAGDGCYWEIASSAPGGPIVPHLGLLHGVAGVGLALAYLGHVTGEEHYVRTAQGAAELLIAQAVASPTHGPVEETETLLSWPGHLDDEAKGLQAHCHGAGGIGQFLLWLDVLAPNPRYRKAAERAAYAMAAQRATETRAGICHGVSGTGHFMLDCYQTFGGSHWRDSQANVEATCNASGFRSDLAYMRCTTREQSRPT